MIYSARFKLLNGWDGYGWYYRGSELSNDTRSIGPFLSKAAARKHANRNGYEGEIHE